LEQEVLKAENRCIDIFRAQPKTKKTKNERRNKGK
jgi:hypothetical protein